MGALKFSVAHQFLQSLGNAGPKIGSQPAAPSDPNQGRFVGTYGLQQWIEAGGQAYRRAGRQAEQQYLEMGLSQRDRQKA